MNDSRRLFLGDLDGMDARVKLGPFRLDECVGMGSMGEVWRGCHVEQDVDVAVKVILSERAAKTTFHRAFRQEVRSMAGLNHPFVVDVYDYGTVDARAEDRSLGEIRAGSPYFAMEYAQGGSLADCLADEMSWEAIQIVLFSLLDALAHSHARGVVHRDIKPHNVLISVQPGIGGSAVKLTDYGLAYALRDTHEVANWHRAAGTPEYMAPELVTGDWRRYGPATDLYALGCLAFEMLEGRPPFRGSNIVQIANAQLEEAPPPLSERAAIPSEMERWLQVALAKDVDKRFSNAADAAWALRQVTGSLDEEKFRRGWAQLTSTIEGDDESDGEDNGQSVMPMHSLQPVIDEPRKSCVSAEGGVDFESPRRQIPRRWQRRRVVMPTIRMVGTGRGIFRLQRLPVLGRTEERDHLWRQLRQCAQSGKVRATLLSGPAGVGKDYLAEWLCDRAGELGAAQVFRAYHDTSDEFGDGMAKMIERHFALSGLKRREVNDFFKGLLTGLGAEEAYEWEAMTEIVRPASRTGESTTVRFLAPKQRYMAYARFLERLARRGPVLLWLNDVQWGLEVLNAVRLLLEQPQVQAPIYVVMTARTDLLTDDRPHLEVLEAIDEHPRAQSLAVEPLDETTIRQLVEEALFLEPSAAYEVARRSGGNPLHALEMVGQWLDRDLLESSRYGYLLRDGAPPGTGGEWIEVWSDVIERLVDGVSGGRLVLELGAVLGRSIQRPVWEDAADQLDVEVPEPLVETLLDRKYVRATSRGLVFTQNLLREALFASARKQGRWEQLSMAGARALDRHSHDEDRLDERVGLLLLEGGESVEGARRLLAATESRFLGREYHALIHLASRGVEALEDHDGDDALRLQCQLLDKLSHGWHGLAKHGLALEAAEKARQIADQLQEPLQMGTARLRQMGPTYVRGGLDEAQELGMEALKLLGDVEDAKSKRADVYLTLAHIELRRGNFEQARKRVSEARDILRDVEAPVLRCQAEYVRLKAQIIGDEEIERREAESVIDRCRKAGTILGEVRSLNLRAEVARRDGELDEAKRWYEKAVVRSALIDPDRAVAPQLNLALIAIENGDLVGGGHIAERVLQGLRRTTRPQMRLYSMAAMAPMQVVRGQFDDAERNLDQIQSLVDELGVGTDPDLELCLRAAVEELKQKNGQEELHRTVTDLLTTLDPGLGQ